MTLRLRLVFALVVLVTAGLALFGAATYSLYAKSQYRGLDDQLRGSQTEIRHQLEQQAGIARGSGDGPRDGHGGGPPVVPAIGTFAELVDSSGNVLSSLQSESNTVQPKLPATLPAATLSGKFFTVGATSGAGRFRVMASIESGPDDRVLVMAIPTADVVKSLHRLVLIEGGGAVSLLLLLAAGGWFLLRRELRPLERMASTARSITAGHLGTRVESGGPTEVGQLGLALNTMLTNIEAAFAERQATEARLRQFLADASHELRTPLTSIQGFAELFRVSGDEAQVDLPTILRRIEEESARMKVLVEELLLLARLDQSREVETAPVDLAVLAADACSDLAATAPDRPVTLNAPEPVVVAGDETHLRQAIANLVSNAVRHTPEGTPIDVSARRDNGTALVSVRDHGPGLAPEALVHAFDRFWQADQARVGVGAGLGLAIVASIAAEHHGSATVTNADGGGAMFTVAIPTSAIPSA